MPESTEQHTKTKNRFLLIGNGIIVFVTSLCCVLAWFIPGMQILALAIGLLPVLTPPLILALGAISAILWNTGCTFVHWLITKKSLNGTHQLDKPKEPLKTNTTSSQDRDMPFVEVVHKTLFPAHFEEAKLQSMFPNLMYRIYLSSSYNCLKDQYREERYWTPKKYKLYDWELPEWACKKGSFEGIKNEVTQEPMLEIPFHMIGLEANTWVMPVSTENTSIIRQMIKANYCGYFADTDGKPTPAANMVTAELDKIESKLKIDLTL